MDETGLCLAIIMNKRMDCLIKGYTEQVAKNVYFQKYRNQAEIMFKSYQSPGLLADETELQALHKIADIKHETDSLFSIKLNM